MGYVQELAMAAPPDYTSTGAGTVVTYWGQDGAPTDGHERLTLDAAARALAALKGYRFAGTYEARSSYAGRLYFVPRNTLLASDVARLPIASADDLFGGVVSHSFIATKTITHPLMGTDAHAPEGWSRRFPERVQEQVLSGYSAFSPDDAHRAGHRMLRDGPIRLKLGNGISGLGQRTAHDTASLDAALHALGPTNIARHGLVVEQNLTEVTTYSVGVANAAGIGIAYYGTQRLTPNHQGQQVYGGSDLVIVQGRFENLLELGVDPAAELAIRQAMHYDAAALDELPGFYASRRNYDVAQGLDAQGYRRSGVLEQSWRIGGATPAELSAMHAFLHNPSLVAVKASSVEYYGPDEPPAGGVVTYRGVDPRVGALTKYCLIEPYGIVP